METNKKILFLFCWLLLDQVCFMRSEDCPIHPDRDLSCYNDFSDNITCFWNGTLASNHMDTVCTISAKNKPQSRYGDKYSAYCILKPLDVSKPAIQKCSLKFQSPYIFLSHHELSLNLSCNQNQSRSYKPACHIKLNPPAKPNVNSTSVSWSNQVIKHKRINQYESELQWKRKDQSWSDPSVQKNTRKKYCQLDCDVQLDSDLLVQGETYDAHVRVQENEEELHGTWSDWSPTESWVSSVGRPKPPTETPVNISNVIAAGLALFGLLMMFVFLKMNKITWVYIVKRVTGPPLPNPGKAAYLQTWLSSNFTNESFYSFFKPVEIVSVEVTATVDAVTPCKPDVKIWTERGNLQSNSSGFSNPSYSDLCTPPVSSLSSCTSDSPCEPVCGQECDVVAEKGKELRDLILKGTINRESEMVISDYEMVGKVQLERLRLQSTDSGMCSHEEVSQESMEAESINVSDGHDEGTQDKEEKKGQPASELDFQNLFRNFGSVLGKQSIQVCSDYEQVPNQQVNSPELPSVESGVGSEGEEHGSQQEDMMESDKPTETTGFLFPPDSSKTDPCTQLFSGFGLNSDFQALASHGMFTKLALMSDSSLTGFYNDDGYLPVSQEQK